MQYYLFSQNNSGGVIYGKKYVIVRAPSAAHANFLAEEFGGVNFDNDSCECCGSRWSRVYGDGYKTLKELSCNYTFFTNENTKFINTFGCFQYEKWQNDINAIEKELNYLKKHAAKEWNTKFAPDRTVTATFRGHTPETGKRYMELKAEATELYKVRAMSRNRIHTQCDFAIPNELYNKYFKDVE